MDYDNLTLHTDKYQINMMYAHWKKGTHHKHRVYEAYFRKLPFANGFAVFAGLERIVHYLNNLRFTDEEIRYLSEQEENYDLAFLEELKQFRFTGTLRAAKEGTLVFPNEPLIQVETRVFEAQLVETAILNFMNFQTLIATKAARIRQVAGNDILLEFGTRRAHEADAAIWGARASYIAGFHATSNMRAGMLFDIPTKGTHAHAWVQDHESEQEAFFNFVDALPDQSTLLVDTYNTLNSGVPHAIQAARRLAERGKKLQAIRLDSGDLAHLSREVRRMLDEAGFPEVKIVASNDLDEYAIARLKAEGAPIDSWGVGTQLITAADQPSLGGVYKIVARLEEGKWVPTIKLSSDPQKTSTPSYKSVYRIMDKHGKVEGDYIALPDEEVGDEIAFFDATHTHLHKRVTDVTEIPLLEPIFVGGMQTYHLPSLAEIRRYHEEQLQAFPREYLRMVDPEVYPVALSPKVWEIKRDLIQSMTRSGPNVYPKSASQNP